MTAHTVTAEKLRLGVLCTVLDGLALELLCWLLRPGVTEWRAFGIRKFVFSTENMWHRSQTAKPLVEKLERIEAMSDKFSTYQYVVSGIAHSLLLRALRRMLD